MGSALSAGVGGRTSSSFDVVVHELVDVVDGGDLGWQRGLVGEQRGVAVGIVWVVAVHGADGLLAHVAGHDERALRHEVDQLAKRPVFKQRVQLGKLAVRHDAPLRHGPRAASMVSRAPGV